MSQLEETYSLFFATDKRPVFGFRPCVFWEICGKVYAFVFVCPSVCVLPPNPENKHSSAEDLPTKFTKGYWERPERTEILCTEWMWPWEVWERHGLRNITKLLLKSPFGRKPSTFNIGAWGWPYVRYRAFDRQSQTLRTATTVHSVWELDQEVHFEW